LPTKLSLSRLLKCDSKQFSWFYRMGSRNLRRGGTRFTVHGFWLHEKLIARKLCHGPDSLVLSDLHRIPCNSLCWFSCSMCWCLPYSAHQEVCVRIFQGISRRVEGQFKTLFFVSVSSYQSPRCPLHPPLPLPP
jgi:hypothetical protein